MIRHSDELNRLAGEDLCPYHRVGRAYGIIYFNGFGPSVCAECRPKYRFAWTDEKGRHLVEIPETPEGVK